MSAPAGQLSCPFCGTTVGARARACVHCRAERRGASSMTPQRFRLFVLSWGLLALPLMAFAFYLAALPWTRTGTPPGYALSLVGAHEARLESRCRTVVFDSKGQRSEALSDGPCGGAGTGAQPIRTAAGRGDSPSPSTRRLAAVLHSTIALASGAAACWLLLAPLRLLFRRRATPTWVRRVAH